MADSIRLVGTVSRGIRCPIIREGDDLVEIAVNSVLEAAESEGFRLNNRDIVAITGLTEYGKTLTDIVIPSEINGVKVGALDVNANEKDLEKLLLPNSLEVITSLGNVPLLQEITIPASVKRIESFAFSENNQLNQMNINTQPIQLEPIPYLKKERSHQNNPY
mgnify:CR=1 FL=1